MSAAGKLANTRTKDLTAARLRAAGAADAIVAADGTRAPAAPDRDGAWGVVSLVAPPAHRAHWIAVAGGLRGARARAEVTLRRYAFVMDAPRRGEGRRGAKDSKVSENDLGNLGNLEDADERTAGVALDLWMLEAETAAASGNH
ncbi:MAG: hypothetical protein EBS84_21570 [Proteobacteria bacterium]|nr:hypothetical protein [Pseudomonadota bacterium]